jgi:hypothetical protein
VAVILGLRCTARQFLESDSFSALARYYSATGDDKEYRSYVAGGFLYFISLTQPHILYLQTSLLGTLRRQILHHSLSLRNANRCNTLSTSLRIESQGSSMAVLVLVLVQMVVLVMKVVRIRAENWNDNLVPADWIA